MGTVSTRPHDPAAPAPTRQASTSRLFRHFSMPGGDADVFDLVALHHARSVAEAFLDRFRSELDSSSDGVVRLVEAWLAREPTVEQVRHPSVGLLRRALDPEDETSPTTAAAALLLHLHHTGTAGAWSASFPAAVDLMWGRWRLPAATSMAVQAADGAARVRTEAGGSAHEVRLSARTGRWVAEHAAELETFTISGRPVAVISPVGAESARLLADHDQPPTRRVVSDLRAAADLLDSAAPTYARWASRALWGVVPAQTPPDMLVSASTRACPWMIMVCSPAGPEELAELLVHESTHQYFYLLSQFGPVDDGTDETLYFSPLKETGRPIDAILLAYHACANMLLMHDQLRLAGHASGFLAERRATLAEQVRTLESHLRRSPSITEIGAALWEPLAERLDALALR